MPKCFGCYGELNYRKGFNEDLLELVRYNEACAKVEARGKKLCPVCGCEMLHVCRVAKSSHFDYGLFEDKFVIDDSENWVVVPVVYGKKKKVDDG